MKKHQFEEGKSVQKDLHMCTYRFVGMPIAMHYVGTSCVTSTFLFMMVFLDF